MSEDLSGTAFGDVDRTGYAQAFIPYLDAASQQFRSLKGSSHEALGLQAGDRVLDVGCGVGDDLRELASLVGPHGYAAGLDSSHNLVEEARRRASVPGAASAEFRVGDVHALPWGPDTFTACRARSFETWARRACQCDRFPSSCSTSTSRTACSISRGPCNPRSCVSISGHWRPSPRALPLGVAHSHSTYQPRDTEHSVLHAV